VVGSSQRDKMANYSALKYKGLAEAGFAKGTQIPDLVRDAGFAKTIDVTSSINSKAVETRRNLIGQLDREVIGGNATTTRFNEKILGGDATTASFAAEYDGGSANG
jgi:hypothetical protein